MRSVKLPYLFIVEAKGNPYYYYRRNGLRLKINGKPCTKEFMDDYHRIHNGFETDEADVVYTKPDSIAAVVSDYLASTDFKRLSDKSKKDYGNYLSIISKKFGQNPIKAFSRKVALAWRDSMAATPAKANYAMAVLRRLMSFAIDRGYIETNPALNPRKMAVGTYLPWPDEAIEAFLAIAPPYMRLAMQLGIYTGQRRGDIIRMTWGALKEGGIELVQQKTKRFLHIPLHTALQAQLEGVERGGATIITNGAGKPFLDDAFSKEWRRLSNQAGIDSRLVFHGLRKNATIRLLEAGCTTAQVKSITGHVTDEMVNHYSQKIDQKNLAKQAMEKLEKK